jgi:hypothetical protein
MKHKARRTRCAVCDLPLAIRAIRSRDMTVAISNETPPHAH